MVECILSSSVYRLFHIKRLFYTAAVPWIRFLQCTVYTLLINTIFIYPTVLRYPRVPFSGYTRYHMQKINCLVWIENVRSTTNNTTLQKSVSYRNVRNSLHAPFPQVTKNWRNGPIILCGQKNWHTFSYIPNLWKLGLSFNGSFRNSVILFQFTWSLNEPKGPFSPITFNN